MVDFEFKQAREGFWDLEIEDGEFLETSTLETALLFSLFTDARANDDQERLPLKRRGWLGSQQLHFDYEDQGSKLWFFDQTRISEQNLSEMSSYTNQALAWILKEGRADSISVSARKVAALNSASKVVIDVKLLGDKPLQRDFSFSFRQ